MSKRQYFKSNIFKIQGDEEFSELALDIFRYQAANNSVYGNYLNLLNVKVSSITSVDDIPHLPIRFFKSKKIIIDDMEPAFKFTSSGTSGGNTSAHYIADPELYQLSFQTTYAGFFGNPEEQCTLALLPSYLERTGSSLVYMIDHFINVSKDTDSGFYLHQLEELSQLIQRKLKAGTKVVLWGVTFALLELAEKFPADLRGLTIIETGGMKGRGKELVREEVHAKLSKAFGVDQIASEYGMTELLSQAYALNQGYFSCPPWMKVSIRNVNDPFSNLTVGRTGGINVIDLANIDSCAFIETEDLGRLLPNKRFEVLGRYDNSDIRGCNLLVV